MDYKELAINYAEFLKNNDGKNVTLYNVENKVKATKCVVVCEKEQETDVKHLARHFLNYSSEIKKPVHTDGIYKGEWVVFDVEDVIVHIITTSAKQKYDLDKMYKDCPKTNL